jgi:hypothetical protein
MHPEEYLNVPCYCCKGYGRPAYHVFLHRTLEDYDLAVSRIDSSTSKTEEDDAWCENWLFFTPTEAAVVVRL